MKNEIMVTVMVTFYNQKQYIFDSLNAIFNQKTNFKYEVICGDDGSSDGTYEELLLWQKKYSNMCKVLQMPREQGKNYEPIVRVSNNRHNLLKHAEGKYVTFIDGDDYIVDNYKLQKQVDLLEKHPECIACGHPVIMLWDDIPGKKEELCRIADYPVKIRKEVYWSHLWIHADALLFRNVYKGKEDRINKDFFDDNIITCYFIKYGDILYIPDGMVVYRQISNSSWNMRDDLQKLLVNIWVYNESKKILPKMKIPCFIRCYFAWKWFYANREKGISIQHNMDLKKYGKIVEESCKYKEASIFFKKWYDFKYYIPARLEKQFNKLQRYKEYTYQKI